MTVTSVDGGYSKVSILSSGQKKIGESIMKLDRRKASYLRAISYDVIVEVTYRRTRRVRAIDPRQAKEFAKAREEVYATGRYDNKKHVDYEVKKVSSIKALPSGETDNG